MLLLQTDLLHYDSQSLSFLIKNWKNELSLNLELSQQRVSKLESDLRNNMERLEAEDKNVRARDLARALQT